MLKIGEPMYKKLFHAMFRRRKPLTRASKDWTEKVILPLWSVRVLDRYAHAPHPDQPESLVLVNAQKLVEDLAAMGTPDQASALVTKLVYELQSDLRRTKDLLEEEQKRSDEWHERYQRMVIK